MLTKKFYSDINNKFISDIKHYNVLSKKEEIGLYQDIINGDQEAKNTLILSNVRYALDMCRKYAYDIDMYHDLSSEVCEGLIIASNKFNYTKKIKFITYASFHVKQKIIDYLRNKSRLVRLPTTYIEKMNTLIKEDEELKETIGVDFNGGVDYDVNQICGESLDTNIYELESEYDDGGNNEIYNGLVQYFKHLTDTERYILEQYFGLNNITPISLSDISDNLGLHVERVSFLKINAIRKIKNYCFNLIH